MAAYLIATVHITDPEVFALYAKGIAGVSEKFQGTSIVKGPVAEFLEGDGPAGERVVVSRFPDAAAAKAYLASPEYQAARVYRMQSADCTMRLLVD
ncbi:MAG: DUF1330 domain-containing protein [Pseudomonadota bacterium]